MTKITSRFTWRRARSSVAALGIIMLATTGGWAAASSEPLSLNAAIQKALANHPAIAGSELNLAAARARRAQLNQPTPWNLEVQLENIAGSGQYAGLDSVEATVGVFKLLERGDKQQLRATLGDSAMGVNTAQQAAIRIEVGAAVAAAFFATLAQQRRAELGEEYLILARTMRDTVTKRIAVGRSAEAELATAEIGLARARYASGRAGNDLAVSRSKLAALMAEEDSRFGDLNGDLFDLPALADLESLHERLAGNPELKQLTSQQTVLTAQRQLAEAEARTDVTVGASIRRLAQTNDNALVFSVNLPLGQRQRSVPGIAYARAQERAAPVAAESKRLQLVVELYELRGGLTVTGEELRVLRQEIIPLAEHAVELYEAGFDRGRYALFELNDAQRTLLEARQDAITAADRYHRLALTIQSLLGEMPVEGAAR